MSGRGEGEFTTGTQAGKWFQAAGGGISGQGFKGKNRHHIGKTERCRKLEGDRIIRIRERIGNNLSEFIAKEGIDENRFEQELIFYMEKLDISEEKVRLANHLSYFLETMEDDGPVGKKLGFISQEMGREINTLGSKANHVDIQRLVVEMKDELERIKEQILNVL